MLIYIITIEWAAIISVKYYTTILGPHSSIPPFYSNLCNKKEASSEKKTLEAITGGKPQTL
jgi:hypothetical protein